MKQKSKLIALSAVVMSMSMSMSIFADNPVGWKQTNGTWQYIKDASGSVYSNGWQWIMANAIISMQTATCFPIRQLRTDTT